MTSARSHPARGRTSWLRRLGLEFTGLAGGLLLVALLSWGLSWLGLAWRTAVEQQALARGESAVALDFTDLGSLIGEQAEGATRVRADSSGLELVLGAAGVNAGLNFRGRVLDTALYPELRLVLDSGAPAELTLIRQAPDGRSWVATQPLPLAQGLNPLKLTLPDTGWKPLEERAAAALDSTPPARISVLRFYLAGKTGTAIRLREARFYVGSARLPLHSLKPWLARPEHWLAQMDAVQAQSPSTLVQPPGYPARPLDPRWWRLAQAGVAALCCGLALLLLWPRGPVALRAAGFWSLCAFPVLALWIGDNPAPALLGFLVGALVLGLRRLPPPPPATGPMRAWALSLSATTIVFAPLLLLGSEATGEALHPRNLWVYPLWALLQQAALQRVLYSRLRRVMWQPAAAWTGALAFALWHAPNLGLMLLTLIGGRLWCELYERSGRLLPVACSHALLGFAALLWLPTDWLRSAEVSSRFLGLTF